MNLQKRLLMPINCAAVLLVAFEAYSKPDNMIDK